MAPSWHSACGKSNVFLTILNSTRTSPALVLESHKDKRYFASKTRIRCPQIVLLGQFEPRNAHMEAHAAACAPG